MQLKPYPAVVDGNQTTLMLDEATAAKLGLTPPEPEAAEPVKPAPVKKRTPANKATAPGRNKAV